MFEDIKSKLAGIEAKLDQLRGYFDVDRKNKAIADLSSQMSSPGFWQDSDRSTKIIRKLKELKNIVEPWEAAVKKYRELKELTSIIDSRDRELFLDLNRNAETLLVDLEKLEFHTLFSEELDSGSAILSINAGAGGTESCDWAQMLLRMYTRFAQRRGYSVETTDILYGEEAGVKSVTLLIEGPYAYGYLKSERGVHRLVRISPFDANKRRHTSFASVDVIPELKEGVDVKIEDKDLRVDVYRSKGAGGQSVNTTDSAVRITHIPTGIVAQCQNERSQHQNKETAFKILKARIYELERLKKEEELLKQYAGTKKRIEFGSQIRSYVMHPYNMIKDHRTDYETGDVGKVMDGVMDELIEAYLKHRKSSLKDRP
ncbi:MAG: peptide chain release factor 2 [Candidatus Omnitrophica bacterium]|nr:peptide chain release factor 2 [Candidatus Omnitrophota bacterium]